MNVKQGLQRMISFVEIIKYHFNYLIALMKF